METLTPSQAPHCWCCGRDLAGPGWRIVTPGGLAVRLCPDCVRHATPGDGAVALPRPCPDRPTRAVARW